MEAEIDRLAATLANVPKEQLDAFIRDKICEVTCASQWDEAVKWNRVKWRINLTRRNSAPVSPSSEQAAANAAP